jgi:hypothetical protein
MLPQHKVSLLGPTCEYGLSALARSFSADVFAYSKEIANFMAPLKCLHPVLSDLIFLELNE